MTEQTRLHALDAVRTFALLAGVADSSSFTPDASVTGARTGWVNALDA